MNFKNEPLMKKAIPQKQLKVTPLQQQTAERYSYLETDEYIIDTFTGEHYTKYLPKGAQKGQQGAVPPQQVPFIASSFSSTSESFLDRFVLDDTKS